MNQDKTLSITPLDSSELAAMPAGMHNITVKGGGYRFLPHGNHFQMAATVVIPFDSTRIPKGYSAKDIHTYYYDENCHKWMVLPKDTVLWQEQLAYASTTHFTDMINGILAVPESPETTGFTPTFLSDIKAADPSTGIMVMQAPEAPQNGAASLAYPINIPEGRKGLTPQIALRYSSDGACSWVGYGWSLDMPTIDIETRWGVPLFDPNTETESYLFNGLSFAEEAHREQMRRSADKEFHLRIENAFSKIVRKGNSPKNYTWEVTANDGSVTEYAPVARQGAENNSNIVQWAVTKQTDINGNTISYEYQQVEGKAYISHINYNGFNGGKGLYDVYFVRSDNPYRPDATSSGRLGFLQYDNQQLERVEVKFQDKLVRSYKLNYVQGEFGKVMLASVTETDSDGADLYTHTFDYYNDIADGGLFEGKTEVWKTGERAVFGTPGFVPLQGHGDNLSIISGSESSGLSIGGGCNISYGWSGADVYTGVNYTYSSGEAEGKVTLADFDGDGLPDKVYVRDNHLWYQRNLLNETGKREFGGPVRVGGNVSQFSSTKNSSHTLGVDLGGNVGPISAGVGYSHTWDKSKTTVYMQDFNGDGLTDIAVKGVVYFNRLVDGVPTFLPYSQETENPILSSDANLIGENFNIDYEAEKKEMEEQSPLH
ncbi:MAG: type IV secretion protein Rhs, partial [Bacteroidales bacterium]|nr:type IV secretion protein Rhs [Bacteroidales bacterium]